jgi:hypothetical protein
MYGWMIWMIWMIWMMRWWVDRRRRSEFVVAIRALCAVCPCCSCQHIAGGPARNRISSRSLYINSIRSRGALPNPPRELRESTKINSAFVVLLCTLYSTVVPGMHTMRIRYYLYHVLYRSTTSTCRLVRQSYWEDSVQLSLSDTSIRTCTWYLYNVQCTCTVN